MKKSDVTYIVGATLVAFTNLFYCCTMWFHIKLPRYYPRLRTWKWFSKIEGEPSQGWYGMQAFAFLAAGIVALIVYLILKRVVPAETSLKTKEFGRWGVFTSIGLQ
jgi:cbb3-type cytochrome oxidase subunit 1